MKRKRMISNHLKYFDDIFVGKPQDIEKNLKKSLPEANALKNKSNYIQTLSLIALAQALQKKFNVAHKTLDKAEECLELDYNSIAHARILLERGRVFHQSDDIKSAIPFFLKSFQISKKHKLDKYATDAAHILAAVVKIVDEKIKWNKIAINIGNKSKEKKTRDYSIIEYQNLGSNYLQAKKYKLAIAAYKRSEKLATQNGLEVLALGSKWGIAKSLRLLNALDEALVIQLELLKKYNALAKKAAIPVALLRIARGQVFEELAEIYLELSNKSAATAYQELSKDSWFIKLERKRMERIRLLRNI